MLFQGWHNGKTVNGLVRARIKGPAPLPGSPLVTLEIRHNEEVSKQWAI